MYKNIKPENQAEFHDKVVNSRVVGYKAPETYDEYWKVVSDYLPELINIVLMHAPPVELEDERYFLQKTGAVLADMARNKDPKIVDYFEKTWHSAPDSGEIHAIRGWNILCDLCSESYLIDEKI